MYNVKFDDFFRISFSIASIYRRSNFFRKEQLLKSTDEYFNGWFKEENIDIVLSHLSTNVDDFKEKQNKSFTDDIYSYLYQFNILREKPIIDINGKLRCPIPIIIADRLSTGVYFDLANYYSQTLKNRSDFTTNYGVLFEDYVGYMLSEFYQVNIELYAANEYYNQHIGGKRNIPSLCDWIIIENDTVILIECKSGKLPLNIASTGNLEDLKSFLIDHYLNKGKLQFDFLYNHFTEKGKKVFSIIIYNDYINIYNKYDRIFEDVIDIVYNINKYSTQFMSVYDFESILPQLHDSKFQDILIDKLKIENKDKSFDDLIKKTNGFNKLRQLKTINSAWKNITGVSPKNATRSRDQ